MLWDVGSNTGEYSLLALKSGAEYAIGWDGDPRAADMAFRAARAAGARLTPLVGDLANPSPSQGWSQAERAGMQERSTADAVMALAVIHHLLFSANVPLERALGWIVGPRPARARRVRSARRRAGARHDRPPQGRAPSL